MTQPRISTSSQVRGTLLVALSGTLFGLIGFLGSELIHLHFSVANMLFWRFLIATLWIMITMVFVTHKTELFHYVGANVTSVLKIFILGAISYSGSSGFYFIASQSIGTGPAMVVFFSFPLFVSLFAWLAGECCMNKYIFTSLLAMVLGLVCLKGQGHHTLHLTGIFFAMLGAVSFAAYVYGSQHTTKNIDARLLTLLVCLGNTLVFFLIACYKKQFFMPHSFIAWAYMAALGILATALPIQCLLSGLTHISPVKASILSVLEPVVTLILGLMLLHETISTMQIIGIFIVLLGAILIQFERSSEGQLL